MSLCVCGEEHGFSDGKLFCYLKIINQLESKIAEKDAAIQLALKAFEKNWAIDWSEIEKALSSDGSDILWQLECADRLYKAVHAFGKLVGEFPEQQQYWGERLDAVWAAEESYAVASRQEP